MNNVRAVHRDEQILRMMNVSLPLLVEHVCDLAGRIISERMRLTKIVQNIKLLDVYEPV